MSLQDSYFAGDVEDDIVQFAGKLTRKRVLVFPPVNNYRRFLIHQLVQERFPELLHTFSIGQRISRRTVVCFKSDVLRDPKMMDIEKRSTMVTSENHAKQRQVKSVPTVQIYRPPAARKAVKKEPSAFDQESITPDNNARSNRHRRRPDQAVYVPRHRRDVAEPESSPQPRESTQKVAPRDRTPKSSPQESRSKLLEPVTTLKEPEVTLKEAEPTDSDHNFECNEESKPLVEAEVLGHVEKDVPLDVKEIVFKEKTNTIGTATEEVGKELRGKRERKDDKDCDKRTNEKVANETENSNNDRVRKAAKVLVISDKVSNKSVKMEEPKKEEVPVIPTTPPEKKVKKITRPKSKPAPPPEPPIKVNRDECDWDSLFDDNGDCLDPTLIEELTSSVGEVVIEQPKNNYKSFTRPVEVSNDEFAHVVEIYNFPSEFKTCDLAAVFSPFKNGGFELKWVDDTHCLGVFSSALIAAEVLATDHPLVKTRPLSEATALSKTKAKRSSEFLQPYKSRPETCAALARRLVTGALGVKLATARQEREHEKIILKEAKEKRRLANKQREDAWEGVIAQK